MGKISPVSYKYIVHTSIKVEGVVDRPDVIGAIFGQTEGLLGNELELRELQRSGRIGRIEVNLDTKSGKTVGAIIIPSSLDKSETVIIAAALETIQRIGPCNAKMSVDKIEDVRVSKRNFVIERAKELLRNFTDDVLPDSQEITEEVSQSVRMMEIKEYGKDRLPAGPAIDESDEIVIVEGRADVLNLLKNGFKNVIGMNGTSVPATIIELCKRKTTTAFVDGDRGGDLIIKELSVVAEIDYVVKAPDGKEVEELAKKEIHKALRSKVAIEQLNLEGVVIVPRTEVNGGTGHHLPTQQEQQETAQGENYQGGTRRDYQRREYTPRRDTRDTRDFSRGRREYQQQPPTMQGAGSLPIRVVRLSKEEQAHFKKMLEDLIGTRGAYILDKDLKILGKVPTAELPSTISSLHSGVHAIVFDGSITKDIITIAERAGVKHLVAMDSKFKAANGKINLITNGEL